MRFNGAESVAKASQSIDQRDTATWLTIYYDIFARTVLTAADLDKYPDASEVTTLIRPNTADEITNAVRRWLSM